MPPGGSGTSSPGTTTSISTAASATYPPPHVTPATTSPSLRRAALPTSVRGASTRSVGRGRPERGRVPRPSSLTRSPITPPPPPLHSHPELSRDNYLDSYRYRSTPGRELRDPVSGRLSDWRPSAPASRGLHGRDPVSYRRTDDTRRTADARRGASAGLG